MATDVRPARHWPLAIGLTIAAAIVAAAALRVIGIRYGLPAVYNPDEVAIMNRAMALAQNGGNPHNFLYPSLYFYALFVWEGAWFAAGRLTGVFGSLAAFERAFFVDPTSIYVAGRLLSALCGVLTVWTTWRLGSRLFGRVAGVSAALMFAVAPLAVRDAHYVKHDVPVTWLIVLTCASLAASDARPRLRQRLLWPSALAGLAMSTHYYAVFLAVPIVVAALWPRDPQPWRTRVDALVFSGLAVTGTFLVASPFIAIDPLTAIRDVVANREIVVDRATTTAGLFGSMPFYLSWLVRDGAGVMTTVLAIGGVVVAWRRRARETAMLLAFPVTFLLFIANTVPASRYLNPIVPFVAMLAGTAVAWIAEQRGLVRHAAWIVLALALADGMQASVRGDLFLRQTDTRSLALDWIERSIPDGASILIQPYSVPLRQSRAGLDEALTSHLGSPERASIRFQRLRALTPYPSPAYRTIFLGDGGLDVDKIYLSPSAFDAGTDLAPLRALGIAYVVVKRFDVDDPVLAPLSAALERDAHLVARVSPYRQDTADVRATVPPFIHNTDARISAALERPGPVVEVWRVD
jgi:hypothetical protein